MAANDVNLYIMFVSATVVNVLPSFDFSTKHVNASPLYFEL